MTEGIIGKSPRANHWTGIMQEKNETRNHDKNINSLTDLMAYSRALNQYQKAYPHLASTLERRLTRHLLALIKHSFSVSATNLKIWIPDCLHSFFNSLNLTFEDQTVFLAKTMIKTRLKIAANDDVKQIIFIGKGNDFQALFASMKSPEIQFFELDDASHQVLKVEAITSFAFESSVKPKIVKKENVTQINGNLKVINYDTTANSLAQTLKKNGFVVDKKTLIIVDNIHAINLERFHPLLNEQGQLLIGFDSIQDLPFNGFNPLAQYTPSYHLDQLGEISAANYYTTVQPQKIYYLLQRGLGDPNLVPEEMPINLEHYTGIPIELKSFE